MKQQRAQRNQARTVDTKINYAPYWTPDKIEEAIKSGRAVSGGLHVNPNKPDIQAFVRVQGSSDIFVEGLENRNRALDGDVVLCEILHDTREVEEKVNLVN